MKLKKIACVAMVAAMSLTSLTAFATVPTPKDNTQAFIYAEDYYNKGLYYEALDELKFVQPIYSHESEKLNVWAHKVADKIVAWEVSEGFRKTNEAYDDAEVVKAHDNLHNLLGVWSANLTQSEALAYDALAEKIHKGIVTEAQAIVAVEDYVGDILWDPDLYYSVVKAGDGWDVYVKSNKTGHNVAAYHVCKDLVENGQVLADGVARLVAQVGETEIDYNGNPASEYEWRGDVHNVLINFPH